MQYVALLILILCLALAYKDPTVWYPYGLAVLAFFISFGNILLSLGKKIIDYFIKKFNIKYKSESLEISERGVNNEDE